MSQTVLVVDDEDVVLRTVEEILRPEGCNVIACGSGDEFLARMRSGAHGVVLMDVMMPGLSGWDTLRAMQNEGLMEGNIVIMLTGVTRVGADADGLQDIVFDYIAKPFTPAHLLEVVRSASSYAAKRGRS